MGIALSITLLWAAVVIAALYDPARGALLAPVSGIMGLAATYLFGAEVVGAVKRRAKNGTANGSANA
jgi:hypothetical protein